MSTGVEDRLMLVGIPFWNGHCLDSKSFGKSGYGATMTTAHARVTRPVRLRLVPSSERCFGGHLQFLPIQPHLGIPDKPPVH